jgi:predicted phosphoribosyltransferase
MAVRNKKKYPFHSREEAARVLCEKLFPYRGLHPLVLAVSSEAVAMARLLATYLRGDMDVLLVDRILSFGSPEVTIGALTEGGTLYADPNSKNLWTPRHLDLEENRKRLEKLTERRKVCTPERGPLSHANRVVLVLDTGLITGSTMLAAIREVDGQHPAKIVAAVAVARKDGLDRVKAEADETVALMIKDDLTDIHVNFEDYPESKDEEAAKILREVPSAIPVETITRGRTATYQDYDE